MAGVGSPGRTHRTGLWVGLVFAGLLLLSILVVGAMHANWLWMNGNPIQALLIYYEEANWFGISFMCVSVTCLLPFVAFWQVMVRGGDFSQTKASTIFLWHMRCLPASTLADHPE